MKRPEFFQLMIFSTFVYIISALIVRFLIILETAVLLRLFSIYFQYRPLGIMFHSSGSGNWTDTRIMIVFGLGTLVFLVSGLLIFRILSVIKKIGFKTRLILTWCAFFLIHILPLGMISGIVFFDGFGIAYTWLFTERWLRLTLSLIILALCIFLRPSWLKLFLQTAYSLRFLQDIIIIKKYIFVIFIVPWLLGTLILLPFAYLGHSWSWIVYLFGLGLVVLPVFNPKLPGSDPWIVKSEGPPSLSPYHILMMILVISGLFLISFVKIEF